MTDFHRFALPAVLLAAALAGCAPQQSATPAPSPAQAASAAPSHGMAGMDHAGMMAHCAQMQQQMRPGTRMSPEMQQMMTQCDQMARSMATPAPR